MSRLTTELFIEPKIVRENIIQLKNKIDASSKFMAIIKSDAYGHILPKIVKDIDDLANLRNAKRFADRIFTGER